MAHKKGVGSSKNGRESQSKRLGVKLFGGEFAKAGNIIVRQRGTAHHPGENAGIGKDHTIYALIDGIVLFRKTKNNRSYISVKSLTTDPAKQAAVTEPVEVEVEAQVAEAAVEAVEAPVAEAVVETAEAVETQAAEAAVEASDVEETIEEATEVKAKKTVRKTAKKTSEE